MQTISECQIEAGTIIQDGKVIFSLAKSSFADFAKAAYQHFNLSYPKFHKMDALS